MLTAVSLVLNLVLLLALTAMGLRCRRRFTAGVVAQQASEANARGEVTSGLYCRLPVRRRDDFDLVNRQITKTNERPESARRARR